MRKIATAVLMFAVWVGTAFAADKIETKELTKKELLNVLIGHTYPLGGKRLKNSKGAIYFLNDGTFEIIWEGKKGTGSWKPENGSKFCYTNTLWSGRECIKLVRNLTDGGYVHIFDGQQRFLEDGAIEKGRKIK